MVNYNAAKQAAETIWKEMCISTPPLPILEVVENYGLSVFEVSFTEQPNASGLIDVEKKIIYINEQDTPAHKRFTIAHELGHLLLHDNEEISLKPELAVYYRKPIGGEILDYEKEANWFAANLLVPMFLLKKYTDLSDAEAAELFAVSQQVIRYRR